MSYYVRVRGLLEAGHYLYMLMMMSNVGPFVSWSNTLSQTKLSQQGWIAMKMCTDIHGTRRMNPHDYDDALT